MAIHLKPLPIHFEKAKHELDLVLTPADLKTSIRNKVNWEDGGRGWWVGYALRGDWWPGESVWVVL